ncbi:MAG: Mannose-1-phosphate guanylyltransferase (EC) / Phosphomannomutase [uncultured Rubrobacteraceae bacterium]|uniref:Mannose-1-phosphate guanylyltransferase (EC ) / Phosphomannomutase n=1 Tax=uncultured Rubrobacteraceae bacterium TaxID=349277 RepID=A0A6J4R702_9ACTN|nr:MAG: Mannose-1-phosphate guanylyltransferase (EC) / Phosphomannomutase [uncultured Rubrobacteraceae bacterium]
MVRESDEEEFFVKAVIMAGGQGTRLRPLTSEQPKPMIPVVNVPCMEHIVNLLKRSGFERIVATLEYMPEVIRAHFGDGSRWGVEMEYSVEEEPLGTAGSVKYIEDRLGERFVVVSGDALTDVDLGAVLRFHEESGAEVTLVLKKVDDPSEFGIVVVDEDGRVERFLEKPDEDEVFSYTANTGIYVVEPGVLDEVPAGQEYDWSKEVFPKLLDEGRPVYGYVMGADSYWEDIGNIEQYMDAQRAVLDGKVSGVVPPGEEQRRGIRVGDGAEAGEGSLKGPVVVGDGVRISPDAQVGPYSVLASGVSVDARATVVGSTVAEGATIGEGAELSGALVGRSCEIRAGARLQKGCALGDGVVVGEGVSIAAGVSVYPGETIPDGTKVSEDVGGDES